MPDQGAELRVGQIGIGLPEDLVDCRCGPNGCTHLVDRMDAAMLHQINLRASATDMRANSLLCVVSTS